MKQPVKMIGGSGGGGGSDGGAVVTGAKMRTPFSSGSFGRPSWLLFSIADMDERMKMLKLKAMDEENASNFAGRAEGYYQKRPQLLALLHDLYNGYVSLGDRYCQALAKNQQHRRRYSSPISPFYFNDRCDEEDSGEAVVDSDVESSLSYQTPFPLLDPDLVMADLVMKSVNYEIVLNELNVTDRKSNDSLRKIELQKSLLDVLESERMIMLNENASLAFRVNALLEENNGLVSESVYMKKKASELARFALQNREDHRVCVLSQKIKDLQEQVNGLEKQNREYYDRIVEHEVEKKIKSESDIEKNGSRFVLDDCFHVPDEDVIKPNRIERKGLKMWDWLKKVFMCVPQFNTTDCYEEKGI